MISKNRLKTILSFSILFVFTGFLLFNSFCQKNAVTINEEGLPLSSQLLFTTKWEAPKSTDTSVQYCAFATRVSNPGQIKYLEIYYVLTEDSSLTSSIMDDDLNIIASSAPVYTAEGYGMQTFTLPDYELSSENIYISLESDRQSIGLGTVQEHTTVASCVTSDNTVSGIQNAQCWSPDDVLRKRTGSTPHGITLYIKAFGPSNIDSATEDDEDTITVNSSTPEKLFATKWHYPTATATNTTYAGLATRVANRGKITSVDIYYVLTEDSILTASIMDTDLNYLVSSAPVTTAAGIGLQHFDFGDYSYNYDELYIALESNRPSIGVGAAQDNAYISPVITGDNSVKGHQNACTYSPSEPLKKKDGSTKGGLSLYAVVYGFPNTEQFEAAPEEEIIADTASTEPETTTLLPSLRSQKTPITRATPSKTVYISSSGSDSKSSGTQSKPYKSLKYAIKQNGNNTNYLLKCGDKFSTRYGITINSLKNVTIGSYGSGAKPIISGLMSFKATSSSGLVTGKLSENDMGVLVINGNDFWMRRTRDANITDSNSYYLDPKTAMISLLYDGQVTSAGFAAPYCGFAISNCSSMVIEDIEVCYYGLHGIQVNYNSSNILIQNCNIHHIGGSMSDNVKLGNGIELWLIDLNNISICDNDVHDCFDAGITAQVSGGDGYKNTNIEFTGNTVTNCRYNFEYFNSSGENTSCDVYVANNILNNSIDLTNGYRERASTTFGAFLTLWNSNGNNDSCIIENNICNYSDDSCATFKRDSKGKIIMQNNQFSNYVRKSNNPQYYHGNDIFQ